MIRLDRFQKRESTRKGKALLIGILTFMLPALPALTMLTSCSNPATDTAPPPPAVPQLAKELIYYDWPDDIPQSVFDAFTAEYGVKVTYLTYASTEEADKNIRAGRLYDVVNLENEFVPRLVADGLLAEIDYHNVPNFKNIGANFRDLTVDPGNRHMVPFTWGTVGLVVRGDLVQTPVRHWLDLWNQDHAGHLLAWNSQRTLVGIALKSLGYSINSENPAELDAALARLLELKKIASLEDYSTATTISSLTSGGIVMMYGWANDAMLARAQNDTIIYVLPEEGPILWGDHFTIPANSPRKYTAEVFINFMLRPEISAQIPNLNNYATTNDAARPFIDPKILNDPIVYPPQEAVRNGEIIMPLSPEGDKLHKEIWARFLAADK